MEFILAGIVVLAIIFPLAYPRWRRWEIARERKKNPRKRPSGGLIAPFDEVFHPTAYTANLIWEAETTLPAPAPNADGNRPDLANGRINIQLTGHQHER